MSHLEQFNGTAFHAKDSSGEIPPLAGANFIPISKAAILKTYKLQYLLQVYAAYTEMGDMKFCALTEGKSSFTEDTICKSKPVEFT